MNDEIKQFDLKVCGITPHDFRPMSNGTDQRSVLNEYTWHDFYMNLNSKPFETDTAIIVTSYPGQLCWLKATLESYRLTGAYVILSFDNHNYIWNNLDALDYILRVLPRPIHYLLAHAVVVKHKTYEADKRTGWYWDVKYAQSIINGFTNIKYVYCTNGDCILEKPEGMDKLKEILGEGDFISGQSTPGGTIHTADVLYKVDAFNKIMDYMTERMKVCIMGSQSPECLLRDAVTTLKLNEVFAQQPLKEDGEIDWYCTQNLPSTFKDVLGFRNLYAELEYRENNGLEPLDKKFFDSYNNWMYLRSEWQISLCKYYETGDRRYLQMWWDMGKDSAEDRKFLPLEAYGDQPIYK